MGLVADKNRCIPSIGLLGGAIMRVLFSAALAPFLASSATAQEPPASFNQAKKFLADLHEKIGHLNTIYCGCPYARTTTSGGDVDRDACRLEARTNATRSDRVEWEQVVPASWFGQTRPRVE